MSINKKTEFIRVLMVDDHSIVREGLRMVIENDPGMEIVGEAANSVDALEIVSRERPDIVLLDIDLSGESGLDLVPEIHKLSQETKILMLTGVVDTEVHQRAVQNGALGVVLKSEASQVLLKAIRALNKGEVWLNRMMTATVLTNQRRQKGQVDENSKISESLTEREHEIIALIAQGCSNKDISGRLYIGEKTVRNYLTTIYDKVGVSGRLELAIYASRHGLDK
jgi:DNA-binding NarL/FixJ family response regulator